MSHVFFASATGGPTDRTCIQVSNPSECVRALSRTFTHSCALSRILAYQHLDYIFCSCTACSLTQGCTVLFFDAGFATLRRLREQLQQPGNHLRLKISSALRRLARRLERSFAVEELRHTLHHFQPLVPGATEVSGSVSLRAAAYAVFTHSLFQSSSKISS